MRADGYDRAISESKLLIGFHTVTIRLRHGAKSIDGIYFETSRCDRRMQDFLKAAEAAGVRLIPADADRLRGIASTDHHQGVAIKTESLSLVPDLDELFDGIEGMPLLLMPDGVIDPHNLGACPRAVDAAGVHAMITPKDRSAGINMTVVKVASGAAGTVPYITMINLTRTLCELQERGVWVIGMADEAEQDLYQADFKGPTTIVMGAEGEGICHLARETCDALASIPMAGSAESLNVSVVSGVCLFKAMRQRAAAPAKK